MSRLRWPLVLAVLVAVGALVATFSGRDDVAPSRVLRSPIAASVGAEGGSWYCSAGDVGVDGAVHSVLVTSVGDADAAIRMDGFGAEGPAGEAELELPAGTTEVVDVSETLGAEAISVMIEADAPVVVEHRSRSEAGSDQAPCSTFSSDRWYFPTVVTSRDATARLSLFNPFPGDASVDIEVAFDAGIRQPAALAGLVVPAGTTRVVDLTESVQRRDQFSATVRTRSGGVVAEVAQTFDGSADVPVKGVRLVPGTRTAGSRWSFAGGFTDTAARERVVVLNPREEPVEVLVQVVPFGGTETPPEPFELTIPGLRYGLVDLDQESRVAQVGFHSVEVETVDGAPVVAARSVDVAGEADGGDTNPLRSGLTAGSTAAPGGPASATLWVSTGLGKQGSLQAVLFVHNPSTDAVVATVLAVGADGSEGDPVDYEVPAGDSVAVPAADLGAPSGGFTAVVESDGPVVVERLQVFADPSDLSLQPSIPVLESLDGLGSVGG